MTANNGIASEKLRETPGATPRRRKTAKFDRKLVEIRYSGAAL